DRGCSGEASIGQRKTTKEILRQAFRISILGERAPTRWRSGTCSFGISDLVESARQFRSAELFRDKPSRAGEIAALHSHNDIENRRRPVRAGAEGCSLFRIPTPRGVLVQVTEIGTANVWVPVSPANAEAIQNFGLAAHYCRFDLRRSHIALAQAM